LTSLGLFSRVYTEFIAGLVIQTIYNWDSVCTNRFPCVGWGSYYGHTKDLGHKWHYLLSVFVCVVRGGGGGGREFHWLAFWVLNPY